MNPFVKMAAVLLEKQAISNKLVERAAQGSLQHRTFEQIAKAEAEHGSGAARARKALKNKSLTPEGMRSVANREANHLKIQEIAKNISQGRKNALKAGTAAAVAESIPRPHTPSRIGGFELPRVNGKKVLIGAGATALGLMAMKALAKRKETEQSYSEPY